MNFQSQTTFEHCDNCGRNSKSTGNYKDMVSDSYQQSINSHNLLSMKMTDHDRPS